MTTSLTPVERETLTIVESWITRTGHSPTIREIMRERGVNSPSAVQAPLYCLREKGLIDWIDGKQRTLRLIKPVVRIEFDPRNPFKMSVTGTDTETAEALKSAIQQALKSQRVAA